LTACGAPRRAQLALFDKAGAASIAVRGLAYRATPERLHRKARKLLTCAKLDPRIIGLTGDLKQVEEFAKGYYIYFAKSPTPDGGYTMDHSSMVILTEKDGTFAGTLDFHEPDQSQLAKLRRLIQAL
jgi:cytochrome oxidase Cu insertion factor (SCO1/SenC/PrrC family)